MTSMLKLSFLLALWMLVPPLSALAHGLQVAAFADGARVEGSVHESGDGPVQGARVRITAPDGRLLAELESDAEGRFVYRATAAQDLLIRAQTPDGHAAEWVVSADEIAGLPRASAAGHGPQAGNQDAAAQGTTKVPAVPPGLEVLLERAVARQLRPLREQLIAYEDRTRLRDLLGGIGYILGLAGLVLWWRGRAGK